MRIEGSLPETPSGDTLRTLGVLKGELSESQTLAKELWGLEKQSKTQL